jgi:hypothetical protein
MAQGAQELRQRRHGLPDDRKQVGFKAVSISEMYSFCYCQMIMGNNMPKITIWGF